MNPDTHPQHLSPRHALRQGPSTRHRVDPSPKQPDSSPAPGTPEAVQAADVDQNRTAAVGGSPRNARRGLEWVRPTDLIARGSATMAGRGIDFQAELARKARAPMIRGLHRVGERAKQLPPIQAFGRGHAHRAATRDAVGRS